MRGTLALTRKTRGQQKALINNEKSFIWCKRLSQVPIALNAWLNNPRSLVLNWFGDPNFQVAQQCIKIVFSVCNNVY